MRRVAVIYNPGSGSRGGELRDDLADRIEGLFCGREVTVTSRRFAPATLSSDVRDLLVPSPDALFVVGGDGTVSSVAEHLLKTQVPLGVIPAGTVNVLAGDLGVPDGWPEAVEELLTAPLRSIDVARVNGRVFLCSSALALLPQLGRLRENARGSDGWSTIALWARAMRLVRRYPRRHLRLRIDGREHSVRTRAVVVSVNPLNPGMTARPSRDRLDGGRLAVYVARGRAPWDMLGIATKLVEGRWRDTRGLDVLYGRTLHLSSRDLEQVSIMSDGEVVELSLPLRIELHPRALTVLSPRGLS